MPDPPKAVPTQKEAPTQPRQNTQFELRKLPTLLMLSADATELTDAKENRALKTAAERKALMPSAEHTALMQYTEQTALVLYQDFRVKLPQPYLLAGAEMVMAAPLPPEGDGGASSSILKGKGKKGGGQEGKGETDAGGEIPAPTGSADRDARGQKGMTVDAYMYR